MTQLGFPTSQCSRLLLFLQTQLAELRTQDPLYIAHALFGNLQTWSILESHINVLAIADMAPLQLRLK